MALPKEQVSLVARSLERMLHLETSIALEQEALEQRMRALEAESDYALARAEALESRVAALEKVQLPTMQPETLMENAKKALRAWDGAADDGTRIDLLFHMARYEYARTRIHVLKDGLLLTCYRLEPLKKACVVFGIDASGDIRESNSTRNAKKPVGNLVKYMQAKFPVVPPEVAV